jgi:hypothetical protein
MMMERNHFYEKAIHMVRKFKRMRTHPRVICLEGDVAEPVVPYEDWVLWKKLAKRKKFEAISRDIHWMITNLR